MFRLFLVHGVSGAGKTTLMNMLKHINPDITVHVKDSNRKPRKNETRLNTGDIRFKRLLDMKKNPSQYAALYYRYGNAYGIRQDQLNKAFAQRKIHFVVLSDIDCIRSLKEKYSAIAIHCHIDPEHLPDNLFEREHVEVKERLSRTEAHQKEYIDHVTLFDHVVVNFWKREEDALMQLQNIILHHRRKALELHQHT